MEEQLEANLYIIQNLYDLISPQIPCDQSRILAVNYSRLRYIDQYGATLLKLGIELVNTTTGEEWTLPAIAKTLPKYSVAHDILDVQAIFKKEVGIYTVARQVIDTFLKENGIKNGEDFFIKILGGRINLNGSKIADHNAALITMDFRPMGYKMMHRRTGFDLETSKATLATLAKFHGSTLALKSKRPNQFKELITPYLKKFHTPFGFEEIARSHMVTMLKNEGFPPWTVDRAIQTFSQNKFKEIREPWATFAHTNIWVENILVKYDKNKQPVDVRLRGFQECEYDSPLRDVIFFLFSSVQLAVLRQYLDDLIDYYYYNLFNVLRNLDADTKLFSRSSFNKELKESCIEGEFYKTVCMLYPILGTSNYDTTNVVNGGHIVDLNDPLHISRLSYIIKEFERRDWLSM